MYKDYAKLDYIRKNHKNNSLFAQIAEKLYLCSVMTGNTTIVV